MSNQNIKLMLVEDNKLIRVGIRSIFDEIDGINVVIEAETAKEAIKQASNSSVDIVILDLKLPDNDGITVIKAFQENNSNAKIIVLSSHDEYEMIHKTLSLGVYAYIIKDINTDTLINVVKTVNDGAMWLDPKIVPIIREKSNKIIPQKITNRATFRNSHSNLTQREYEVLKLVVDGKSNNDIAQILCISEHTAKAHVCNIIQKLVVDDRTQAAVKALKEGIV
ncbi:response regulator transcription factor [bacterium]|nr:response regulator transcription factor [bacterium]